MDGVLGEMKNMLPYDNIQSRGNHNHHHGLFGMGGGRAPGAGRVGAGRLKNKQEQEINIVYISSRRMNINRNKII